MCAARQEVFEPGQHITADTVRIIRRENSFSCDTLSNARPKSIYAIVTDLLLRTDRVQSFIVSSRLVPSIYAYNLWRRTANFYVATHVERSFVFGVNHTPPNRAGSQPASILGVPFYLRVHFCRKNCQIWRGNTYREGLFLGVSKALTVRWRGPALERQFGGSLLFLRSPFVADLPNVTW